MTTVTFGQASAPYAATRTVQQIATNNQTNAPIAASILSEEAYMDDVHYSCDTITEAVGGRDELISILRSAGFELRKGTSNENEVLEGIPEEYVDQNIEQKFLVLRWNRKQDTFSYAFDHFDGKEAKSKSFRSNGFCSTCGD